MAATVKKSSSLSFGCQWYTVYRHGCEFMRYIITSELLPAPNALHQIVAHSSGLLSGQVYIYLKLAEIKQLDLRANFCIEVFECK